MWINKLPFPVFTDPIIAARRESVRNLARVIVGTRATGIDEVADSLRETNPGLVTVATPATLGGYRTDLETGATDAQRLLVVADLTEQGSPEVCAEYLNLALGSDGDAGLPSTRAASRTVALLAGLQNTEWLLQVAGRSDVDELVMPLERYDQYTLPLRWRGEGGLDDFAHGDLNEEVRAVTDGWPQLVEELAVLATPRRGRSAQPRIALEKMRSQQGDADWCRRFLIDTGALLTSWPDMDRLINILVDYATPCSPKDIAVLAAGQITDLDRTVRLARWFGLVTLSAEQELTLSPLPATCWQTVQCGGHSSPADEARNA